jgi:hypothetical protein
MSQSQPQVSRAAVSRLLDLLNTPRMELSGELSSSDAAYQELIGARLLAPAHLHPSSVYIDENNYDVIAEPTGPGYRYFSAGAGWVSVDTETLQRYRVDPIRVLAIIRDWLEISDRTPIATLTQDTIWDLGDMWLGKRKLAVLFMRRAHLSTSIHQLRQALQFFPRRKFAIVITDAQINAFGFDFPGEPLCCCLMDLIPPSDERVERIDQNLIAELLGMGLPKRVSTGPVYCSDDGGELVVNNEIYHFTGDIHRSIIRQLTDAWLSGNPRVRTSALLENAESSAKVIKQVFSGSKLEWQKIIGYGQGFSWLIVQSD